MERRGFDLKSTFHIISKTYKDKKQMEQLGKNPQNYENIHNKTFGYEQKPIKINDFNEAEEKEVKGRVEKEKYKEGKLLRKVNFLNKKRKLEENKKAGKEMWGRLKDLNKEFKDIKEQKK